jgi:lipoprotein-anchoring transpeptidase ErfK/SrfK
MARLAMLAVVGLAATAFAAASLPTAQAASGADQAQMRLVELGYMSPAAVSGRTNLAIRQAVMAFQGWEGLPRDGVLGPVTRTRLAAARRPEVRPTRGTRIEIDLSRQVALLVRRARVVRAIHVSTGGPGTPTPAGRFRIYRKERESWSVPFRVWLPWASYFSGGVALHGYPDVPAYPASHGCVRIPLPEAAAVYAFARLGVPVDIVA